MSGIAQAGDTTDFEPGRPSGQEIGLVQHCVDARLAEGDRDGWTGDATADKPSVVLKDNLLPNDGW